MFKKTQKMIAVLFAVVIGLFSATSVSTSAESVVRVFVDGKEVAYDVKPIIKDGRTMVPIRFTMEFLNANVTWIGKEQKAVVKQGSDVVEMIVGKKVAYKNGVPTTYDAPPILKNGRTLVPLRFISESFGYEVVWNQKEWAVYINTKKDQPSKEDDTFIDEEVEFDIIQVDVE